VRPKRTIVPNHRRAARSQLDRDVCHADIIATGTIVPAVPLDAAPPRLEPPNRTRSFGFAGRRARAGRGGCAQPCGAGSDGIGGDCPPPEVAQAKQPRSTKGIVGPMNLGPVRCVAPAPQLTLAEHIAGARGGGSSASVACSRWLPPSFDGGQRSGGRLTRFGHSSRHSHRTGGSSWRQSPGHSPRPPRENPALRERRILRDSKADAGFNGAIMVLSARPARGARMTEARWRHPGPHRV